MLIGILGGTFDPIHAGHLHVAHYCLKALSLDSVRLIPCFIPVHRAEPTASAKDRLAMIQATIKADNHLIVDTREIDRGGPSYMFDTLTDLQRDFPHDTLCLILGDDAFEKFDQWYRWRDILHLCHLIVVHRAANVAHYSAELQQFITQHQSFEQTDLQKSSSGIIFYGDLPPAAISATTIRQQLAQHKSDIAGIPPEVQKYIIEHKLYDN